LADVAHHFRGCLDWLLSDFGSRDDLEDSGELATGSFYAGIPTSAGVSSLDHLYLALDRPAADQEHAWRVALGHATSGAAAAGLLGLLVSRGSSLLMEGIEDLKAMTGKWENAICMVSGFVPARTRF